MNREIKFRAKVNGSYVYSDSYVNLAYYFDAVHGYEQEQFTGLKDKNGKEIYYGDILRFADKVEWYRSEYWAKVAFGTITKKQALEEIENRLYEQRVVESIEDYEWLLSNEIQVYWEVCGNIYENPELLKE